MNMNMNMNNINKKKKKMNNNFFVPKNNFQYKFFDNNNYMNNTNNNNSINNVFMNMNKDNIFNLNNEMNITLNKNNTNQTKQTLSYKGICLCFIYHEKEVYLDCDPDEPFNNILSKLFKENEKLKKIRIKKLINNGKILSDLSKSCRDYRIKTKSKIFLID